MSDNIFYIDDVRVIPKQELVVLEFEKIIDFVVEYTLELKDVADEANIKECVKLIFDRFKNDYEHIEIEYK